MLFFEGTEKKKIEKEKGKIANRLQQGAYENEIDMNVGERRRRLKTCPGQDQSKGKIKTLCSKHKIR